MSNTERNPFTLFMVETAVDELAETGEFLIQNPVIRQNLIDELLKRKIDPYDLTVRQWLYEVDLTRRVNSGN